MTRPSIPALALTAVAATATALAMRFRHRAEWYSQDEIDGWQIRARIELADIGHLADVADGQIKTIVCRHEDPDSSRTPWYWHAMAATTGSDRFRPTLEQSGWARTRADARRAADTIGDCLLDDLLDDGNDDESSEYDDRTGDL